MHEVSYVREHPLTTYLHLLLTPLIELSLIAQVTRIDLRFGQHGVGWH